MARELSEKDIEIFKKAAPDYEMDLCPGSGMEFKSIFPPLSKHISKDNNDFRERLSRLSENDWNYLTKMILSGDESISCLSEESFESVLFFINKISSEDARRIRAIYDLSSCGMI